MDKRHVIWHVHAKFQLSMTSGSALNSHPNMMPFFQNFSRWFFGHSERTKRDFDLKFFLVILDYLGHHHKLSQKIGPFRYLIIFNYVTNSHLKKKFNLEKILSYEDNR